MACYEPLGLPTLYPPTRTSLSGNAWHVVSQLLELTLETADGIGMLNLTPLLLPPSPKSIKYSF